MVKDCVCVCLNLDDCFCDWFVLRIGDDVFGEEVVEVGVLISNFLYLVVNGGDGFFIKEWFCWVFFNVLRILIIVFLCLVRFFCVIWIFILVWCFCK